MIIVTVREALGFHPSLTKVMQQKLPVKAAYRLSRIAAKLAPEITEYEKRRFAVFKELGTPVEGKADAFEVKGDDAAEKVMELVNPLLDEEIRIDLEPLSVDMLGNVEIAAYDLLALEKVIS